MNTNMFAQTAALPRKSAAAWRKVVEPGSNRRDARTRSRSCALPPKMPLCKAVAFVVGLGLAMLSCPVHAAAGAALRVTYGDAHYGRRPDLSNCQADHPPRRRTTIVLANNANGESRLMQARAG